MEQATAQKLIDLNRQFYQTFGEAFANTRRRIQPGIRKVLEEIPKAGDWLDLGCGSGALAVEWIRQGRQGSYTGLDFSEVLLDEARRAVAKEKNPGLLKVEFQSTNIAHPGRNFNSFVQQFDGVMAFAVLHHIPGSENRIRLLKVINDLLKPNGVFIHSEWQFQNSPKWMARVQPWSLAGINENMLEPGDTLLDWKHSLPGQPEKTGLRYVHLFSREELDPLARLTGFVVAKEFESDGEGGRLGLYQAWQKAG